MSKDFIKSICAFVNNSCEHVVYLWDGEGNVDNIYVPSVLSGNINELAMKELEGLLGQIGQGSALVYRDRTQV